MPRGTGCLRRYIVSIYRMMVRRTSIRGSAFPSSSPWSHSVLELAVLGLLSEQPLHGYELKKRLSDTLGPLWGISFGSLYPALRRLDRSGAIEATEADGAPAAAIVP